MGTTDSTLQRTALRYSLASSIQSVLSAPSDTAEADRLMEKIRRQSYRNPTLYEGDSGCMLALLQAYEQTGRAEYLACSRHLSDTLYLSYRHVSLGYGLAGTLLAYLYDYFLTKDPEVLAQARVLIEKLVLQIRLHPQRNYLPVGISEGTTGIWLVLAAARALVSEPAPIDGLIERLLEYEDDYLERNRNELEVTSPETLAEIESLRAWVGAQPFGRRSPAFAKLRLLQEAPQPAGRIFASSDLPDAVRRSLFNTLGKIATLPATLSLPIESLVYQQVYAYFPRVLDKTPHPFDFTEVWDTDVIHTCLKFKQKVAEDPARFSIDPNLFQLESFKFDVEFDIRKLSKADYWEAEKKENEAIFKATMLEDSEFENVPLVLADHVFMITLSDYVTKAPEIEIHPSQSYLVVFKPTLLADYDYTIVEDCMQGLGGLIRSIAHYGKPITPAALARLVVKNVPDPEDTYHRIIQSLRKFTFRRFLKPANL